MMRIILILALCGHGVLGQRRTSAGVPSLNRKELAAAEQRYFQQLRCVKRLDKILSDKWNEEIAKINTNDLGNVEPEWKFQSPSKMMYNTAEQEWLLEEGSTSRPIDSCVRGLVSKIGPMLNQGDANCLNSVFGSHIEEEIVHEEIFKDYLRETSQEQLPFRRFVSFTQFVEMMFQNRNPDALTPVEKTLYEHAESYLETEEDKVDRTFIMEQECEWKNAKALREAPNENARYAEFVRQIRDSVNQQLGSQVVKKWNLNLTLSNDKLMTWQKTREEMVLRINEEVAKLRTQRKDAQWLCEYATKLAYQFSDKEAAVLLESDGSSVTLEVSNVAEKARGIEEALEKKHDFRHPVFKNLVDEYKKGTMCLTAFLHLIQNHQRFDMALLFVKGDYNYPQFFCKEKGQNLGLINTRFCKCVGSFCVAHSLAAIFAEEYTLEQAPDGTYRVVRSGLISRKKVQGW